MIGQIVPHRGQKPAIEVQVPAENLARYAYAAGILFSCLETHASVLATDVQEIRLLESGRLLLRFPIVYDHAVRDDHDEPGVTWWRPSSEIARQESLPDKVPLLFPAATCMAGPDGGPEAIADGERCCFDIFGATFYLASGQWELDLGRRDPLGRIRGTGSFLEKAGLVDMPVVNYYAALLRRLLRLQGLMLDPPRRRYRRMVSCDVDRPRDESLYSVTGVSRRLARNLLLERSPAKGWQSLKRTAAIRRRGWSEDPNNTFDWMAKVNEQAGNEVTFNMLAGGVHRLDGTYSLDEEEIRSLGRDLIQRGHRIGLHGSFDSHFKPGLYAQELERLQDWLEEIGGDRTALSNRQHYLRWNELESPALLSSLAVGSDSTLGFFDRAGFRRGLCTPFPLFDLARGQETPVIEQSLVAMEACLLGNPSDPIDDLEAAVDDFDRLASHCRAVGGDFVLLWHNSFLETPDLQRLYQRVIEL